MTISAFAGFDGFGADSNAPPPIIPAIAPPQQPADNEPVDMAAAYLAMGVRGVGGYLVGRALAPSRAQAQTYGLIGAACGGTLGTLALGIFAALAMHKRGAR